MLPYLIIIATVDSSLLLSPDVAYLIIAVSVGSSLPHGSIVAYLAGSVNATVPYNNSYYGQPFATQFRCGVSDQHYHTL
jgi:hypothetical protein